MGAKKYAVKKNANLVTPLVGRNTDILGEITIFFDLVQIPALTFL